MRLDFRDQDIGAHMWLTLRPLPCEPLPYKGQGKLVHFLLRQVSIRYRRIVIQADLEVEEGFL